MRYAFYLRVVFLALVITQTLNYKLDGKLKYRFTFRHETTLFPGTDAEDGGRFVPFNGGPNAATWIQRICEFAQTAESILPADPPRSADTQSAARSGSEPEGAQGTAWPAPFSAVLR